MRYFMILLFTLHLTGCAAGVQHGANPVPGETLEGKKVRSVTIRLTEEAKQQLPENLKFNMNTLLDHVQRAMDANGMLGKPEESATATRQVEIVVKDIRTRSNFAAVMFGFMAGDDHVVGDVLLKDGSGNEIKKFEVSASYALGGLAGGQDDSRMSWLYEKFTELTIQEFKGGTAAER